MHALSDTGASVAQGSLVRSVCVCVCVDKYAYIPPPHCTTLNLSHYHNLSKTTTPYPLTQTPYTTPHSTLSLQDFAEKIFGFRSQQSLLQAKTEVKLSNRHSNRLESFGPSSGAPSLSAAPVPATSGSGSGSGRGGAGGGGGTVSSSSSISSFFSSASTSSFFSSSSSPKSSTNIPMSQYGQQTQSNSEKRYVVGSMTTRKEIEQDAKDDVSQFNITFSEVR